MTDSRRALRVFRTAVSLALELALAPAFVLLALAGRYTRKQVDVGLGPEPLINNVHHKKALEYYGYSVETFVNDVYFITDSFDIRGDLLFRGFSRYLFSRRLLVTVYLFARVTRRYRSIYIYFNGGPLGLGTRLLKATEPWLLKCARVKVVVMPYGGDVQDLTKATNLLYKHAMSGDYREHRLRRALIAKQVDRWTRHADHVLSGCDWVDYMYHWDTLMLGHFSIEADAWRAAAPSPPTGPLRVLHAPNHRRIKGSDHFIAAARELVEEGASLELVITEHVPNAEIRRQMETVDVVADQLVIGWYAMFSIEAMSMGKAVLCHLREDLLTFYEDAGLVERDEIPIIPCSPSTVKGQLRRLVDDRELVREAQRRGPGFVRKHHSTVAVGAVFDTINRSLGIAPTTAT